MYLRNIQAFHRVNLKGNEPLAILYFFSHYISTTIMNNHQTGLDYLIQFFDVNHMIFKN